MSMEVTEDNQFVPVVARINGKGMMLLQQDRRVTGSPVTRSSPR